MSPDLLTTYMILTRGRAEGWFAAHAIWIVDRTAVLFTRSTQHETVYPLSRDPHDGGQTFICWEDPRSGEEFRMVMMTYRVRDGCLRGIDRVTRRLVEIVWVPDDADEADE